MAALVWGAATHAGRVRVENEDAFVAEPMVFAVADGMGGHQAGEVASALAANTMRDRLQAGATSADVVVAAVVEANAAIFQTAHINTAQRGMGTTLTAMAVLPATDGRPEQFAIVNVGDSRVYLARAGELTRATVDHSYVQELLATGHITEAEARAHPRRNIVTRALGIEPTVRVDSWQMPLVRADRFVLCSDGLVDEVDDDEIHRIILANVQPQDCADALVAVAVENGGRDNVTVIVVDVVDGLDAAEIAGIPSDAADDDTVALTRSMMVADADVPPTLENPVVESKIQQQLGRQITAKTFLMFLVGAVVLTLLIVWALAAALGGDDSPVPTTVPTTVPETTPATVPATATTSPTTDGPTTTDKTTTIRTTTTVETNTSAQG